MATKTQSLAFLHKQWPKCKLLFKIETHTETQINSLQKRSQLNQQHHLSWNWAGCRTRKCFILNFDRTKMRLWQCLLISLKWSVRSKRIHSTNMMILSMTSIFYLEEVNLTWMKSIFKISLTKKIKKKYCYDLISISFNFYFLPKYLNWIYNLNQNFSKCTRTPKYNYLSMQTHQLWTSPKTSSPTKSSASKWILPPQPTSQCVLQIKIIPKSVVATSCKTLAPSPPQILAQLRLRNCIRIYGITAVRSLYFIGKELLALVLTDFSFDAQRRL